MFPAKVVGIFTDILTIPDVRSSDANTYSCVISNKEGNLYSRSAQLTVTGMWLLKVHTYPPLICI